MCDTVTFEDVYLNCDSFPVTVGSKCDVSCDEGFASRIDMITCQDAATWSDAPLCEGKRAFFAMY